MTWFENYDIKGRKARFIPCEGQPEWVWPCRAFQPDSYGGSGVECLGTRYDVLARDNPPWAETVVSAAIKAEMPLRARRIGSAGKYRFWRLCASSPAEAEASARQHIADRDAARAAEEKFRHRDRAKAFELGDRELLYRRSDKEPLPAVAALLGRVWSPIGCPKPSMWWDSEGVCHDEGIDGLRLIEADGRIRAPMDGRLTDGAMYYRD